MDNVSHQALNILFVEDSADDASLVTGQLRTAGYEVKHAERVDNEEDLEKALGRRRWDIVFSDFSMPRFNGAQALEIVREHDLDLPFIIVSGTVGEERAVQLMKLGAQDYVIKGNVKRLIPAVERELREATLRRDHRVTQDRTRELAYVEPLTGLPNRHRLADDIESATAGNQYLALLLVNFNSIRDFNGALGRSPGHELLKVAASRLQSLIDNYPAPYHLYADEFALGKLYHLHGNEFALLIDVDDQGRPEHMAQEIARAFSAHFPLKDVSVHMKARIGLATLQRHENAAALLQRAGLAAEFAKRDGMSLAWYDVERDPENTDHPALAADLRDALFTDQLWLAFQPKISCRTGEITGCEALLRWHHPQRGLVPPDVFIGIAERAGLIDDIALHVVRNIKKQIETWSAKGLSIPIALNLSKQNLQHGGLMEEILQIAQRGFASHVELEITESALTDNPAQSLAVLRQIHDAGMRIYIDDFGTGFSSPGNIRKMPVYGVKIDKSFVINMDGDDGSEAIVLSTIGLAHALGLAIVAEGVETETSWMRLAEFRCDEVQGFYFSKPLKADEFEAEIRAPWWRMPR